MGWFDKPGEMEPAVAQALRLARDWDLPFSARSITRDEQVERRHRTIPLWLIGYAVLAFLLLLMVAGTAGGVVRGFFAVAVALPILVGFGFLVQRAGRDWAARPGIRDPRTSVEIGADGIIVRGDDGAFGMRWFEIKASIRHSDPQEETGFAGLEIDSPLGRIDLCDQHYHDGRTAAALIVRGLHDAYWQREREKVERIL